MKNLILITLLLLTGCAFGGDPKNVISTEAAETTPVTPPQDFSGSWPFDTAGNYTYDGTRVKIVGSSAKLLNLQLDEDNDTYGFGGGNHVGTGWDSANSWVDLNSEVSTCENCAYLDSSWTPQWASVSAYWKMDDAGSSITDSTGNGHTGTASAGSVTGTTAKVGAFSRSFSSGDVTVPDHDNLSPGSGDFSVSFWFYANNLTGEQFFLDQYEVGNSRWNIRFQGSQLHFYLDDGTTTNNFSTGLFLTAGVWHHVAIAFDKDDNSDVFLDGFQSSLDMTAINDVNPLSVLWIGEQDDDDGGGSNFSGFLDDLAIWKGVALSSDEVQTIYQRQRGKYTGVFTSRIMDTLAAGNSFTGFNWVSPLPFGKELPDAGNSETSSDYSAMPTDTLMTNIRGLWHLNGNWNDDSGLGNNGTANGNPRWANGFFDSNAARFDGTGDYMDTGIASGQGTITFAAWIFVEKLGTRSIFGSHDGASDGSVFKVMGNGKLELESCESSPANVCRNDQSTSTITTGDWFHVAYTMSTGTLNFYINGAQDSNADIGPVIYSTGSDWRIGDRGDGTEGFYGRIDEAAMWTRTLTSTEIWQLYRRGANRLRFQVRSCDDADCDTETWKGPDNTSSTFFSELNNNSVPEAQTGNTLETAPNMTFSDFTTSISNNRYIQYRAFLESDNTDISISPQLASLQVSPIRYASDNPTVINTATEGFGYSKLQSFSETVTSCSGTIKYQLSPNAGSTWYWYTGGAWTATSSGYAEANSASEITGTQMEEFYIGLGAGTLWLKTFLNSTGTNSCELGQVDVVGAL